MPKALRSLWERDNHISVAKTFAPVVEWSEPLLPASVVPSNVTLRAEGGTADLPVTVGFDYAANHLTITPAAALAADTRYTVTLLNPTATGLRNLMGTPLFSPYKWSFRTRPDPVPPVVGEGPYVTDTVPAAYAGNVQPGAAVQITFSEDMDETTLTTATVHLRAARESTDVPVTTSYDSGMRCLTLSLEVDLAYSTHYDIVLDAAALLSSAATPQALQAQATFSFVTAADPGSGGGGGGGGGPGGGGPGGGGPSGGGPGGEKKPDAPEPLTLAFRYGDLDENDAGGSALVEITHADGSKQSVQLPNAANGTRDYQFPNIPPDSTIRVTPQFSRGSDPDEMEEKDEVGVKVRLDPASANAGSKYLVLRQSGSSSDYEYLGPLNGGLYTAMFQPKPPAAPATQTLNLLPVDIAVDADRNGLVEFGKDTTSPQKPFRYWINDDRDHGENDDDLSGDLNHSDSIINGIRDLEDVTQVKFKIPQVLTDMAKAGTAQLGFKWKDVTQGSPSVRIWSGSPNIDKPDYLKDRDTAFQTLDQNIVVGTARLVSGTSSVWLRNNLMNEATSDTVNLLMEGVTVGVGKLTFMIKVGTQESEGPSIDLKLLNVRQMYERGKITLDAPAIPNPWDNPNPPALTWVWDPWNWQPDIDPNADKKTIAYVHGWRMTYDEYLQWGDTTFKRLWQLGYKGRFYAFRWPTYHGDNNGVDPVDIYKPGGATYNPSEYRAWLSGPALASFVNGLPNGNARYLIAHSMGNVTSSSALRNNMQVTRYAMCNSAMAAMAYDATIVDPECASYVTPDTDPDQGTRQTFGLANKANPAGTEIVSFSLSNDYALRSWSANNELFKPQTSGIGVDRSYAYLPSRAVGHRLVYGDPNYGPFHEIRPVASIPEAMGYVTQSRSRAAGRKLAMGGSVTTSVDMAPWGFGEEHSAEWEFSIQKTYPFWKEVLKKFDVDVTNR